MKPNLGGFMWNKEIIKAYFKLLAIIAGVTLILFSFMALILLVFVEQSLLAGFALFLILPFILNFG